MMGTVKNNNNKRIRRLSKLPKIVVVTKTEVASKEMLFPEKMQNAQRILAKTKFLP